MCRRSDSDSVHWQSRVHASSRERGSDMGVTLAQPRGAAPRRGPQGWPLMEKFVIEGGAALSGTVVPAGNKNGALPCLASSILTDEEVVVRNVPRIRDVEAMLSLLEELGARVEWRGDNDVAVCCAGVGEHTAPDRELSERIRASFLLAGPLLARFGHAEMPPP